MSRVTRVVGLAGGRRDSNVAESDVGGQVQGTQTTTFETIKESRSNSTLENYIKLLLYRNMHILFRLHSINILSK